MNEKKIKILLAKLGLDVHNRGVLTVAKGLSNLGMEVVYIGNAFPEKIIDSAIQEGVDVVGVSCLSGAHLTLGSQLMKLARKKELLEEMVFIIGGVIPPQDVEKLKSYGFEAIFLPGTTITGMAEKLKELVNKKWEKKNED